jgi:acyl-CoA thioesterase-2
MSNENGGLAEALSLEVQAGGAHVGRSLRGAGGRGYGGSALSHMIHRARLEAPPAYRAKSINATFHRPASADKLTHYDATTLHRSRTFVSIRIEAQQDGVLTASGTVLLHVPESSPAHAETPVDGWSGPLDSDVAANDLTPSPDAPIRLPFEVRTAIRPMMGGTGCAPMAGIWVRATEPVAGWADAHQAALAWISDFSLTRISAARHHAHGERFLTSLSHSMWFHADTDTQEWHLYELHSPVLRDGISLATGRFFQADGRLVATANQECLVRYASHAAARTPTQAHSNRTIDPFIEAGSGV